MCPKVPQTQTPASLNEACGCSIGSSVRFPVTDASVFTENRWLHRWWRRQSECPWRIYPIYLIAVGQSSPEDCGNDQFVMSCDICYAEFICPFFGGEWWWKSYAPMLEDNFLPTDTEASVALKSAAALRYCHKCVKVKVTVRSKRCNIDLILWDSSRWIL